MQESKYKWSVIHNEKRTQDTYTLDEKYNI